MKKVILFAFIIVNLALKTGTPSTEANSSPEKRVFSEAINTNNMNSYISLFEIPATDISRAINFYQAILDISIERMEMPGMEMGILPYENQTVHAVIMKSDDTIPSANGITVYLNAGDDLQNILDKVEENGGKILLPKTAHADESGFFALFLDTEGNKLGLNSPN